MAASLLMAICYYQVPTPGYAPEVGSRYDHVEIGGGPDGDYIFAIGYQRNGSLSTAGPAVTVTLSPGLPPNTLPLLPVIRYWWTSDPVVTPASVNAEGFTYNETLLLAKFPGASSFTFCGGAGSTCGGVFILGQLGCDEFLGGAPPSILGPPSNPPCWGGPFPIEVPCPPSATLLEVSFGNGRDVRFDDDRGDYKAPHWTRFPSW